MTRKAVKIETVQTGHVISPSGGRLLLLAVDETSLSAVTWLVDRFMQPGDMIHLLNVDEDSPGIEKKEEDTSICFNSDSYKSASRSSKGIQEICDLLKERDIYFEGQIRRRKISPHAKHMEVDTHKTIIDVIDEMHPELVVMGSSKRIGR